MSATTSFRYDAMSPAGHSLSGTIEAVSDAEAREKLRQLGLAVRRFEAVRAPRTTPLNNDDLIAFNEQLAQLAKAGLPVEHGLKLLAADMSRGRLKRAVDALLRELDSGASLSDAIERHRLAFPPLYARLIESGVRVGNLPAVLFNLSQHLDLTRRVRSAISRSMAYPTAMFVALVIIATFMSAYVLPGLMAIFSNGLNDAQSLGIYPRGRGGLSQLPPPPTVPFVTQVGLWFGRMAPYLAVVLLGAIGGWMLLWPIVRGTRLGMAITDSFLTRLPLIGPALRFSLVGRWCDAARIGVDAGLDLPAAFSLASDTIGSRRLAADSAAMTDALSRGESLSNGGRMTMLPTTVPATIDLAGASGQLPNTLGSLAAMYLRQAEHRARLIPLILTPILTLLIAIVIGTLMAAMFVPITRLLKGISGI